MTCPVMPHHPCQGERREVPAPGAHMLAPSCEHGGIERAHHSWEKAGLAAPEPASCALTSAVSHSKPAEPPGWPQSTRDRIRSWV